jgi:MoCo/4Fe-4S cofactor protein with predicted Tat translocation signal
MSEIKDEKIKNEKKPNLEPDYWKSFEELHQETDAIEASHHEFQDGVTDDFNPNKLSGLSRRKFLALVASSAALAGAGCSDYRDEGDIIPYNHKPESETLGRPNFYASTAGGCQSGCGVLVKTREGRPIKVIGNPDHPVNQGKACAKCEASILSLYDPERLKNPLIKSQNGSFIKTTWQNVDDKIRSILSGCNGKEIAIISHRITSPSTKKLFQDFQQKYPGTKIYSYDLLNENIRNSAWKKTHGADVAPLIKWDEAKIIVALEADFLGVGENKVENAILFAKGREVKNLDKFNRLYVVEGNMSVTGSNADYRIRLRPDAQYELVRAISDAIAGAGANGAGLKPFADKYSIPLVKIKYLVDDLIKNKGKAIVYAGDTLSEDVHIAVNKLNETLTNSSIYRTDSSKVYISHLSSKDEWENLINNINSGNVAAVIHFDSNPVYHLPGDFGYSNAIKKVSNVISLVESENESSAVGNFVLPINNALEAWGDFKTRTGFYSMRQPVISSLYNSRQKEAALLFWTKDSKEQFSENLFHDYMMNHWENDIYPSLNTELDFKRFWLSALHDGVAKSIDNTIDVGKYNSAVSVYSSKQNNNSNYVISLKESYATGDGRLANNGWMQELPHPVSKITWDNYAAISLSTAKELGVSSDDIIEINVNGKKLEIPVFIQPGAADKTVTIELGYGRSKVGIVGTAVGFDASVLMSKNSGVSPWIYNGEVNKGNGTYKLVTAQEHHTFDVGYTKDAVQKRGIIREGTLTEYKKNPHFLNEYGEEGNKEKSLYYSHDYPGVKWGMAIDLNKCLGCGECVVACNSENNIPIVGKDQVAKGREMQWMRIDRYYSGTPDDPNVSTQPMLCQQCDHAPCENVCPVLATTHSPDGLNQMIYNRCVGTRYCSNNCPYKVRRFNFFNFRDHFKDQYQQAESFDLVYNPEVTIRSRGVMEKCTFCVQRIMNARSDAIAEGREVKGTDVRTACQDACNTEAIKFGDMNDKDSEFFKYRNHELGYYVLEDLDVRPNVTYLAKLRNTHPEEV